MVKQLKLHAKQSAKAEQMDLDILFNMERKKYLTPSTQIHGVCIDVIMQNVVSDINSEGTDITPGGGGHGDGNAKETDPWKDGIWKETEESKEEDIINSLW